MAEKHLASAFPLCHLSGLQLWALVQAKWYLTSVWAPN